MINFSNNGRPTPGSVPAYRELSWSDLPLKGVKPPPGMEVVERSRKPKTRNGSLVKFGNSCAIARFPGPAPDYFESHSASPGSNERPVKNDIFLGC